MDSSQEGAFNARKATLSLDLKGSDGGPLSLSSPAKSPLGSALALNTSMEITAAQKQYAQGFFDALRSVHSLNNFEFDNKKQLLSPSYVVPTILGSTDLHSPFLAATPTSNRDLQAILQAMVATPLGSGPAAAAAATGFPNAFSSIIPGPSTTTSSTAAPSTSASNGSSEGSVLKADIKQEIPGSPDDSGDTMSSRSSSVLNSSNLSSSSRPAKLDFEFVMNQKMTVSGFNGNSSYTVGSRMSLDEQERRKLERKRARNRAAASKCRQKKMDRINELENQVQAEKVRSQMLDSELLRLRAAMAQLENIVQRHQMSGSCPSAQC